LSEHWLFLVLLGTYRMPSKKIKKMMEVFHRAIQIDKMDHKINVHIIQNAQNTYQRIYSLTMGLKNTVDKKL